MLEMNSLVILQRYTILAKYNIGDYSTKTLPKG
jgi:hypothetical protein